MTIIDFLLMVILMRKEERVSHKAGVSTKQPGGIRNLFYDNIHHRVSREVGAILEKVQKNTGRLCGSIFNGPRYPVLYTLPFILFLGHYCTF